MTSTTEIDTRPVAVGAPLAGLDEAWRMAKALAMSNLLPAALRNKPSDVLVTVLYGQEIGISPMQALQSIYVVNGRPSMSGQLWLAKVRAAGHRVKISDHTDQACTVTIRRGDTGDEHTETFTWADAEKAKLTNKDVWKQWPKRMLMWRAVTSCATVICPEVALGFEMTEALPDQPPPMPVVVQRQDTPPELEAGTDADIAEHVAALEAEALWTDDDRADNS